MRSSVANHNAGFNYENCCVFLIKFMEILLVRSGCLVCIGSSKHCKYIDYGIYIV